MAELTFEQRVHRGQDCLNDPLRNKGTAFTLEERRLLGIEGHIPPAVETIEDQLMRTFRPPGEVSKP